MRTPLRKNVARFARICVKNSANPDFMCLFSWKSSFAGFVGVRK